MTTMHQRAVELERQLAEALGHEVAFVAASGSVWVKLPNGDKKWMPRPARDIADCVSLMHEVGVWPRERSVLGGGAAFEVTDSDGWLCHTEPVEHGDDRKAYFMLAAVAGAIAVLGQREAAQHAIKKPQQENP
jgi:hypothetical protein